VRDEEFKGSRYDFEFDGKTSERFAVDLSVEGVIIERFAGKRVRLEEIDAFGSAEFSHPQGGQIAEIAEAVLRG